MTELVAPVLASLVWSLNPPVVSRWAKNAPPALFTSIRALMALVFLVAVVVPFSESVELDTRVLKDLPATVLLVAALSAVLGPGLGDAFYVKSIQVLGGSLAVTIGYTYIVFTGIFSVLLGVEGYSILKLAGALLAIAGVSAALLGENYSLRLKGLAYAVLAAICWGMATVLIRLMRDFIDPLTLSIVRLSVVFAVMLLTSLLMRERLVVNRGFIIATSITGIMGWGVGMVLFTYSIYRIGPSATAVTTALTPVLSQATSRLIAGERPTVKILLGALLVASGIFLAGLSSTLEQ